MPSVFKYWTGPYTARRGTCTGYTIRNGLLGAWRRDGDESSLWIAEQTNGVVRLQNQVLQHWGGGGVLIFPGGWVIKPLPDQVGTQYLLGRLVECLSFDTGYGETFDMAGDVVRPGEIWSGPYAGLECVMDSSGAMTSHRVEDDIKLRFEVYPTDAVLAQGFRRARPWHSGGRVRVTEGGLVLTMRKHDDGEWRCHYVGRADLNRWIFRQAWLGQDIRI